MQQPAYASQSALEWFFQTGSAESNFPSTGSSPEVAKVRESCLQLVTKILALDRGLIVSSSQLWNLAGELQKSALAIGNTRTTQDQVVDAMHALVGSLADISDDDNVLSTVRSSVGAVIVDLVMLAKASRDVGIRQRVIQLAQFCASTLEKTPA